MSFGLPSFSIVGGGGGGGAVRPRSVSHDPALPSPCPLFCITFLVLSCCFTLYVPLSGGGASLTPTFVSLCFDPSCGVIVQNLNVYWRPGKQSFNACHLYDLITVPHVHAYMCAYLCVCLHSYALVHVHACACACVHVH